MKCRKRIIVNRREFRKEWNNLIKKSIDPFMMLWGGRMGWFQSSCEFFAEEFHAPDIKTKRRRSRNHSRKLAGRCIVYDDASEEMDTGHLY